MSLFNEMFQAYAAPALMSTMSTQCGATIIYAHGETVCGVTAILRHETTVDEVEGMRVVKRYEKEVDFVRDDNTTWKGFPEVTTTAKVVLHGPEGSDELWNVHEVRNRTATFIRLVLVRKTSRERHREGFYRESGAG